MTREATYKCDFQINIDQKYILLLQKSPTQSLKILVGERDPQFFESQYIASVPEDAETQYKYVSKFRNIKNQINFYFT